MIHRFAIGQTDFGITTTASMTGGGSINISAGTTSILSTAFTFSNSNGVTFGIDTNAVITASVQTNYLTTAMASNRGSDFVQATANFFGTNASGTIASNAISVSVAPAGIASVNISGGTTSSNVSAVTFKDSNGVSFGFDGSNVTATVKTDYQSSGAYLTTAMASNRGSDFVQATAAFAGTNASGTINSTGISVSVGNYITTAMASNRGSDFVQATAAFAGTNASGTINSTGISVSVGNYLTTAMASNRGSDFVQATAAFAGTNASGTINSTGISVSVAAPSAASFNISAGTTSSNVTGVTFSNGSGVSFGYDGTNVTATVQTNYLTTAPAALTVSDFATSMSVGTLALDLGAIGDVQFQLSTATGGQATLLGNIIIPVSANVNTNTVFTLQFANSNNVSWGLAAGGVITASVASGLTNIRVSAGTTSQLRSNWTFADSNGVSFGLNTTGVITATVATNYAGTGFTSATTAGTAVVGTQNSAGLSLGVPAYLTAAAAAPITFSASNTSYALNTIAFSNSNGVSFGLGAAGNSSIMTASIATTYAGTGFTSATTAGTAIVGTLNTSGLSLGVPAYLTAAAGGGVAISNSQTLFSTGTVALSEGGGAITIASSAGGQSLMFSVPQTSSITGVNGISIAVAGSTISVSQNVLLSYFENMPYLNAASTTLSASGSVLQVVPFVLPAPISFDYFRFPVSMSYVSTEASGTTANTTYTVNRSYTDVAMIMSQNFGASSLSLAYLTSGSATWVFQNQIQAAAQGSRYTVTQNVSYPISGTTSNYTTSYPQSSANVQLSSASMTLFTGPHWLDLPMSISLSAGNYWLVLGRSTNSATQAGNAALGGASMGMSYIGASQNNLSVALMGAATNSSNQLQPGLGSWSTNAAVRSTSSMALASISAMSSGPKLYFQMIRYA